MPKRKQLAELHQLATTISPANETEYKRLIDRFKKVSHIDGAQLTCVARFMGPQPAHWLNFPAGSNPTARQVVCRWIALMAKQRIQLTC
jgi:hypothetical protein